MLLLLINTRYWLYNGDDLIYITGGSYRAGTPDLLVHFCPVISLTGIVSRLNLALLCHAMLENIH